MNYLALKNYVNELFTKASINLNGSNPWDPQIHQDEFYPRIFKEKNLGLGESYMEGWWDCSRLDEFFNRVVRADLEHKIRTNLKFLLRTLILRFINIQTKSKSLVVGEQHYDLGNDLYEAMLDKSMNYTCGFWPNANTLEEAQLHKMELTCQKLMLKPGMTLLDIGCGFGALAKFAAENYGVKVVGVSISKHQVEYGKSKCAGLPVEIRFQDYRDVNEKFDRVVSLGMFEHVGHLNYSTYMKKVHSNLKDNGLFLLHTIGSNISCYSTDPWIGKYIFPNGMLPSIAQIAKSMENIFVMEDWHNFGPDYDKTLMAWYNNFEKNWDQLKDKYDQRFHRMWRYYLLLSAGVFRARNIQLWQIVLSKEGVIGGYQAPRPYKFEMSAPKNRDASPPVTAR